MKPATTTFPDTQQLGEMFGDLHACFHAVCGPTAKHKPMPDYVSNVMGDGIVPSFRIRLPDGSYAGDNGKPFHVGRAVDALHIALKGMMINFRFAETFPPPEIARFINGDLSKEIEDKNNQVLAPHVGKGVNVELSKEQQTERLALPMMASILFERIKSVKLTLVNRHNDKDSITVDIPNEKIILNASNKYDRGSRSLDTPVPLAAVLWALQEGRTGVLGAQHSIYLKYFIGMQEAFSEHMQLVQKKIQEQLDKQAPGKKVTDYLYLREADLKKTIQEESHHLAVARMLAFAHGKDPSGIEDTMALTGIRQPPLDLKNDKWAARDTAVAIYSAARSLRFIVSELTPRMKDNGFLQSGLKVIHAGGDDTGNLLHERYAADDSKLLKIADEVSKIKPESGKPLWRTVQATIRSHPEWLPPLQDLWLRSSVIDRLLLTIGKPNPAIYLVGDIVPQVTRPQQLATIAKMSGSRPKDLDFGSQQRG